MRDASEDTTAIMTVGSVRGKERFEIPLRVAHEGRDVGVTAVALPVGAEEGRDAMSVGGQMRFIPALMESVGWPHCAQKGFRAFQSSSARALHTN